MPKPKKAPPSDNYDEALMEAVAVGDLEAPAPPAESQGPQKVRPGKHAGPPPIVIHGKAPASNISGMYPWLFLIALLILPCPIIMMRVFFTVRALVDDNTLIVNGIRNVSVEAAAAVKSAANFEVSQDLVGHVVEVWDYHDPDHAWEGLCQTGLTQSPIDIDTNNIDPGHVEMSMISMQAFLDVSIQADTFWDNHAWAQNNGHATLADDIQLYFSFEQVHYRLRQFHFHTPSEHSVDGERSEAEVHFVFQQLGGSYLVLGFMFERGATSPPFVTELAAKTKTSVKEPVLVNMEIIEVLKSLELSETRDTPYWTWSGSLTTPPCTEGVRWVMMQHKISISKNDLMKLELIQHFNSRPIQKRNGRKITASWDHHESYNQDHWGKFRRDNEGQKVEMSKAETLLAVQNEFKALGDDGKARDPGTHGDSDILFKSRVSQKTLKAIRGAPSGNGEGAALLINGQKVGTVAGKRRRA